MQECNSSVAEISGEYQPEDGSTCHRVAYVGARPCVAAELTSCLGYYSSCWVTFIFEQHLLYLQKGFNWYIDAKPEQAKYI